MLQYRFGYINSPKKIHNPSKWTFLQEEQFNQTLIFKKKQKTIKNFLPDE